MLYIVIFYYNRPVINTNFLLHKMGLNDWIVELVDTSFLCISAKYSSHMRAIWLFSISIIFLIQFLLLTKYEFSYSVGFMHCGRIFESMQLFLTFLILLNLCMSKTASSFVVTSIVTSWYHFFSKSVYGTASTLHFMSSTLGWVYS